MTDNDALRALAAARTRPVPAPPTPQCEHPVILETQANGYPTTEAIEARRLRMARKGYDASLCSHSSSHVIGRRHYCAQHAGHVALAILLRAGDASVIGEPS